MGVVCVCLFSCSCFGLPKSYIWYDADELSPGRWQYTYEISNTNSTQAIEEITIWCDFGLYENLAVETPDPPAGDWSEIVLQPEPVLQDDGAYDAKALLAGIGPGETVGGFAVSFDWLGDGEPGSQLCEIIDPAAFETIDSGLTIPEPETLLLLGLGAVALRKRRSPPRQKGNIGRRGISKTNSVRTLHAAVTRKEELGNDNEQQALSENRDKAPIAGVWPTETRASWESFFVPT